MARIADAADVYWISAQAIIYYGSVPSLERADGISKLTGFSAEEILRECERCRAESRRLHDEAAKAAPPQEAA